jgi:hypothetical protein
MSAGMVDQVHVVDAGGACGHAGQARQAAVDMGDHLLVGGAVVFQHVLDQVDPAARTVEFVAERDIGRAGSRAETAMDTFPENLLGFGDTGILKLLGGEIGLHVAVSLELSEIVPSLATGIRQSSQLWGLSMGSLRPSFCSPTIVRMTTQSATRSMVSMPIMTIISNMLTKAPSRPSQKVRIAQV